MNRREYQAIKQNPEQPSRWEKLANEGPQVAQFKDVASKKFVPGVVDGEINVYEFQQAADINNESGVSTHDGCA
jgi:hypothetical protein